jgi:hypothetical protein
VLAAGGGAGAARGAAVACGARRPSRPSGLRDQESQFL